MDSLVFVSTLLGVLGLLISLIGGILATKHPEQQAWLSKTHHQEPIQREKIKVTIEIGSSRQVIETRSTSNLARDVKKAAHQLMIQPH